MSPAAVRAAMCGGAALVDTRPLAAFAAGHLPGALQIEFNLADLAERAALLLPRGVHVVVHAEPQRTVEASLGLLEDAGLSVGGHLEGGLAAWRAEGLPVQSLPLIEVRALQARLPEHFLLDVREAYEFAHSRIEGAVLLPSGQAWARSADLDFAGRPVAVVCSGTARAVFVASLLARRGVPVALVRGGMYEWERQGLPVVGGA